MSDDSRGSSTQSIMNKMERDCEERSVVNDIKRSSIHSNWSDLVLVDIESEYRKIYSNRRRPDARASTATPLAAPAAKAAAVPPSSPATQKTIKNIVLVPFTQKPNNWGRWQVKKLQLASSTAVTPNSVHEEQNLERQEEEKIELAYQPHSPYYSPVHLPEFYKDELENFCIVNA